MMRRRLALLVRDLLWSPRALRRFERRAPLGVNFCFHVEHLADRALAGAFLRVLHELRERTGVRACAAVLAWTNPLARARAARTGMTESEYADLVARVAEAADVGMHAHFFRVSDDPASAAGENRAIFGRAAEAFGELDQASLIPLGQANYDEGLVAAQFEADLAWLRAHGLDPKVFAGGQWLMSAHLAGLLQRAGFIADTTIRTGHTTPLGDYLADADVPPRGTPFRLPPTERVVEIQSVFYPTVHPSFHAEPVRAMLETAPDRPLGVVLPAHETEAVRFTPEIRRHVALFSSLAPAVQWIPVDEMARRGARSLAED